MIKSTNSSTSRYTVGGTTEDYKYRLGWWERKIFVKSQSDVTLYVEPKYSMRPDLLAFDLYGKASLMWVILQYNNILDITEFVEGLQITLPTKHRLFQELLSRR